MTQIRTLNDRECRTRGGAGRVKNKKKDAKKKIIIEIIIVKKV